MSILEEVCLLSCENWIDSFPDVIPKHKFSKKHIKKMKEIFRIESKSKNYRLSKKAIKLIIFAAILLSIALTAFAIPASREFIVEKLFNHSKYNIVNTSNYNNVDSLVINYIPTGFVINDDNKYSSKHGYYCTYVKDDMYFSVDKVTINSEIGFDTEKYQNEIIEINGIESVYFISNNNVNGIIFNNGEYIYIISGNISKQEIVNIARSVE